LTPIAEDIGEERKESKGIIPPDDNVQSEHGSICEILEEFNASQVE
jgi:hypothetical protein